MKPSFSSAVAAFVRFAAVVSVFVVGFMAKVKIYILHLISCVCACDSVCNLQLSDITYNKLGSKKKKIMQQIKLH